MRVLALVAVALLLLATAMVWQAPATMATNELARASSGALVLADAEGTVWAGRGTFVAGSVRVPVRWRTDPRALLQREIAVAVLPPDSGAVTPRAKAVVGKDQIRLRDMHIVLPAQAVADAVLPRPRLAVSGTIDVASPGFEWPMRASSTGSVAATWHGASIGLAGSPSVALGEVSANLRAANGHLAGPLTNAGGEFAIDGVLDIAANGAGVVRGVVRPRREGDPRFEMLRPLGTPEGSGVRMQWQWPAP